MSSSLPNANQVVVLDFATIQLFDNYLISTIHEGVIFDKPQLEQFYEIFDEHYSNRPFGYISNRIHEYSIVPTCYLKSTESPWLAAMGVYCISERAYDMALFEQKFYTKRPFKPFRIMDDCMDWVQHHIARHNINFSSLSI